MATTAEARGGVRLGATVVRSLREGALWVFGALALIVLAALITYDRNDPSFATTGEPGPMPDPGSWNWDGKLKGPEKSGNPMQPGSWTQPQQ